MLQALGLSMLVMIRRREEPQLLIDMGPVDMTMIAKPLARLPVNGRNQHMTRGITHAQNRNLAHCRP